MHLGPYSPSLPLGPLALLLLLPHGLAMQRHDTGHKDEKERVRAETENERVGPRCIECKVHALKTASLYFLVQILCFVLHSLNSGMAT